MNDVLAKEIETKRIDHWLEVKVRLSPGVYAEIERINGYGSVRNFLEQYAFEYAHYGEGR